MADSVLVIGEALVDVVERDGGTTAYPGGSPMNVAYGLARLGLPTRLVTEFGEDEYGELIDRHLASAGVTVERSPEARARRTSSAIATIGADGAATYAFDLGWRLDDVPDGREDVLHVGSVAAFLEPGSTAVRRQVAAAAGGPVITFDANIRPALVGRHVDALRTFEALSSNADVVKMSDEDASWLFPGVPLETVAARCLEAGAALFAVTKGADGSMLAAGDAVVEVPGRPVRVADTIGAGDAFMSGLIFALLDRALTGPVRARTLEPADLSVIGGIATASAAITVGRAGAVPPTLEELRAAIA